MKIYLLCFFLACLSIAVCAQADTISNSFERIYKTTNPSLRYSYDPVKQLHDYSGNWDFDKDGKTDQLYFIGTGGAHLYYYLRVVLSRNHLDKSFHFLQSDMPMIPDEEIMKEAGYDPVNSFTRFAVADFDKDSTLDIFIRLDEASYATEKNTLKKYGIKTEFILLSFGKGKPYLRDCPGKR
jgi:hypothetical protein